MRKFSNHDRTKKNFSILRLVIFNALILPTLLLLTGCGKSKSAADFTAFQPALDTNQAISPTTVTSTVVAVTPDGEPDLRQLNRELIRCVISTHHGFKTIDEFATAANVQIPPAPPGKKYALDKKGYIVLVDR